MLKPKIEFLLKCIKSVSAKDISCFTDGKMYESFSWHYETENIFHLSAIDDAGNKHIVAESFEDDIEEFKKDSWFKEHFEVVQTYK